MCGLPRYLAKVSHQRNGNRHHSSLSPQNTNIVTVAAIRTKAAVMTGNVGGVRKEMVVDSGSSVLIVRKEVLNWLQGIIKIYPVP